MSRDTILGSSGSPRRSAVHPALADALLPTLPLIFTLVDGSAALAQRNPRPEEIEPDSIARVAATPSAADYGLSAYTMQHPSIRPAASAVHSAALGAGASAPATAHENFATRFKEWLYRRIDSSLVDVAVLVGGAAAALWAAWRSLTVWLQRDIKEAFSGNVTSLNPDGTSKTRAFVYESSLERVWGNKIDRDLIDRAGARASRHEEFPFAVFPATEFGSAIFRSLRSYISARMSSETVERIFAHSEQRLEQILDSDPQQARHAELGENQGFLALTYDRNGRRHIRLVMLPFSEVAVTLADPGSLLEAMPRTECGEIKLSGDSQRLLRQIEMSVCLMLHSPEWLRDYLRNYPSFFEQLADKARKLERLLVEKPEASLRFLQAVSKGEARKLPAITPQQCARAEQILICRPSLFERCVSWIRGEKPAGVHGVWFTVFDPWHNLE